MEAAIAERTKEAVFPVGHRSRRPQHYTRCRRHPKLKEGPGVCSRCLSEKLSMLFSKQQKGRIILIRKDEKHVEEEDEENESLSSSPSSVSSGYSSSDASSCSSPNKCIILPGEGKDLRSFSSRFISRGKDALKSRSLAVHPRNKKDTDLPKAKQRKRGFWARLLLRAESP